MKRGSWLMGGGVVMAALGQVGSGSLDVVCVTWPVLVGLAMLPPERIIDYVESRTTRKAETDREVE